MAVLRTRLHAFVVGLLLTVLVNIIL
jgi:hypothetical protein